MGEADTDSPTLGGGLISRLRDELSNVGSRVRPASQVAQEIRARIGWRVREFDLGLLRRIRADGMLAPVLGAGVSMGAGAPSWSDLVRLLLGETLHKGLELYENAPTSDNPEKPPIEQLPDGSVIFDLAQMGKTWTVERRVIGVKKYTPEQERIACNILSEVTVKGASTDVETLMHGAEVCYQLCGQELFRFVTQILYRRAKQPSEVHRAIAELAHAPDSPPTPGRDRPKRGWEAVVTYNFDALVSEALAEQSVPHAVWAIDANELAVSADRQSRDSPSPLPIFHLHGYTPRHLFLITNVGFVFSTSQFQTVYKDSPRSKILQLVYDRVLRNPVHVALYVGCSFTDQSMNGLLADAISECPGRYHYAFLQWPRDRRGKEPDGVEIQRESARYLQFGVRPIWFDDFSELPGLIRQLR
jgi:hypothetical protein